LNRIKNNIFLRLILYTILTAMLLTGFCIYNASKLPDRYFTFESELENLAASSDYPITTTLCESDDGYSLDCRFLGIPIGKVDVEVMKEQSLIVGGQTFGIKMFSDGLIVVGFSPVNTDDGEKTPAFSAGLRLGDIILSVDGEGELTNEKFAKIIKKNNGNAVILKVKRDDFTLDLTVKPEKSTNGDSLLGCFVRDSTAGIGTITFIDPVNGIFGGLGHGVYDSDTGSLMPLRIGIATKADVYSVIKGEAGAPGELRGIFDETVTIGTLYANTDAGVFGLLDKKYTPNGEIYPIGLSNEVQTGEAKILCSTDENGVSEYTVNIDKIVNQGKGKIKNMIITVTDEKLIEKTGGIVQGMSGSPIIQDGKLIGAVTHVMVGDSCKGYGIFIENMLSEAGNKTNSVIMQ